LKNLLLFAILAIVASSAKSQDLLFKVDQSGLSYKSAKTRKFVDAEIKDTKATIVLQNNRLIVDDSANASFTLTAKGVQTKVSDNVIMYRCAGRNDKNLPFSFQYTLNLQSKEAVVEFASNKLKSYYFGTFSSSDLTRLP
jgi:hypothetical protein